MVSRGMGRRWIVAVVSLCASACGSGGSSGPPPATMTTRYLGAWAGPGGEIGALTLQVQSLAVAALLPADAPAPVGAVVGKLVRSNVAGTVRLEGEMTLGRYDATFSGGGFQCTGFVDGTALRGTCTGADATARPFELHAGTVRTFCGAFAGTSTGTWNVVAEDGGEAGAVFWSEALTGTAQGTLRGPALELSFGVNRTATGTVSGDRVDGNWSDESSSGRGTFSATATACPSLSPG